MNRSNFVFCFFALIMLLASCNSQYYTIQEFKRIKKADTHIHIASENTALAEQAKEDNFHLVSLNVDLVDEAPLEKQRESSIAQHKQFPAQVDFTAAFTLENFGTPNWTTQTIAQLKRDFSQGALGIKIWKCIGMRYRDSVNRFIMIDDPRFDSVIEYVIQQDKTIVGHLGEPKNCWLPIDKMTVNNDKSYYKEHPQYHMYLHPEYPSYEEQISARDRFIERHPNMRFVGAHLGSLEWSVDELAKRLDKYPNMAVDMTDRICHLQYQSLTDREKIRQFFMKYQDRLIYGTDMDIDSTSNTAAVKNKLHKIWITDWEYFVTDNKMTSTNVNGVFIGLKLPKEVVDKIYYLNAVRWFKLK